MQLGWGAGAVSFFPRDSHAVHEPHGEHPRPPVDGGVPAVRGPDKAPVVGVVGDGPATGLSPVDRDLGGYREPDELVDGDVDPQLFGVDVVVREGTPKDRVPRVATGPTPVEGRCPPVAGVSGGVDRDTGVLGVQAHRVDGLASFEHDRQAPTPTLFLFGRCCRAGRRERRCGRSTGRRLVRRGTVGRGR